jgi:Raf kinase inhibitor-like YbhB/YbcL family protein
MMRSIVCLAALFSGLAAPALADMSLTSNDIQPGGEIPLAQIYTRCGGENISPELTWRGAPAGTKSFVLTMIDSSVKPSHWSHWIVVDLPTAATTLARGAKTLPHRARAIASNFGDAKYDGPCPPSGSGVHEYQLTIWALPIPTITLAADMNATDLSASLANIALDHATLTGFVRRLSGSSNQK